MPAPSLLFYAPSGLGLDLWAGEVVCAVEHGQYCHCACRISATEVIEAVLSGVRLRTYDPTGRDESAVEVPCALNVEWLRGQIGKRYDLTALVLDVASDALPEGLHLYDSRQGQDDCARLCAEAAGLDALGLTGPVTPQQVYEIVTARENNA